jgi:hypothetical protein
LQKETEILSVEEESTTNTPLRGPMTLTDQSEMKNILAERICGEDPLKHLKNQR